MDLLDRLFKKKQAERIEEKREIVQSEENKRKCVELNTGNVTILYPDGLPLMVLEYIDYSKFGSMLKQEQLLPPSYDRRPIKVDIDEDYGKPRVILTFKSKTTDNCRLVSIFGYRVAYSEKINQPLTILEVNQRMSEVWRNFAEITMYRWERGYRFELLDHKRKGEIGKSLMQENMENIKKMGNEYMKVLEEQHKDL